MKNCPGAPGSSAAALDAEERVRPDRLDAGDPTTLTTRHATPPLDIDALLQRQRPSRRARSRSRRRAARAPAIVVMHGTRATTRGLADRVAVARGALPPSGVFTTRSHRPRRIRSTTGPSPFVDLARPVDPGRRGARARCRAVATQLEAELRERARAIGTTATLSASRTERNAAPARGSGRPAARSAFANAVAKSAALAITSPVERISGPSTGSAPGKRANGSTAALTW